MARLETEIDLVNARLHPLNSFVLPGGTALAAYLHLARTVTRRAERAATALAAIEPVNPEGVKYLNRLSDLFFVLGRAAKSRRRRRRAVAAWTESLIEPRATCGVIDTPNSRSYRPRPQCSIGVRE